MGVLRLYVKRAVDRQAHALTKQAAIPYGGRAFIVQSTEPMYQA